jgi:hypothetical protein
MSGKWNGRIGWVAAAALVVIYCAIPYVTIHRLLAAIDEQDFSEIDRLVDRAAMRESLQMQMRERSDFEFPPGLQSGVFRPALDSLASPEAFAGLFEKEHADRSARPLFFTSPTRFRVDVSPHGKPASPRVSLLLTLTRQGWRVTDMQFAMQ